MQFPFRIIESRISRRDEFDVTDGCQPTHALFYLKKGSFRIEVDGEREELSAGDCLILPDYLHFHRNVIDPIEFVYVKFADNLNCPYSFRIQYGKATFKDRERFASNILAFEQLLTLEDSLSTGYREHILRDILFQLYFEQREIDTNYKEQATGDRLVESAVTYITENIGQKMLIQDICKHVGTNTSTLNYRFRRMFNMSVGQFVTNERMKKARHFLMGTTYSISDIATRCGFDNVYYFSNAFKKMHGVSPAKYKSDYT